MAKGSFGVSFDKENDLMSLFMEGKKAKFSFDLNFPKGDVVVDFGFQGEIVGIEFFNASSYFPLLKKVKSDVKLKGKFSVQYSKEWAQVSLEVFAPGMEKSVVENFNLPYSKEIILRN